MSSASPRSRRVWHRRRSVERAVRFGFVHRRRRSPAAFLGPASACPCAAVAEFAARSRCAPRARSTAFNLLGVRSCPGACRGDLVQALTPTPADTVSLLRAVRRWPGRRLPLNFAIVAAYRRGICRTATQFEPPDLLGVHAEHCLNVAARRRRRRDHLKVGLGGIVFALTAVFAFSYMAHLLERSRHRAAAVRVALLGRAGGSDALARHPRPARRAACRRGRPVRAGHRRGRRHERGRAGARAHGGPAARHRALRALRPRRRARDGR